MHVFSQHSPSAAVITLSLSLFHSSLFCSGLFCSSAFAAPSPVMSEFDAYKTQQKQDFIKNDPFKHYKSELLAAFSLYQKKTARVWGVLNVMPNQTNWVSYQNNINQRSIVDFEHGLVKVSIALPLNNTLSDETIKKKLQDNIQRLLKQSADTRSLPDIAKQPALKPLTQELTQAPTQTDKSADHSPLLQQQVADELGNAVKPENYENLSRKITENITTKTVLGDDGKRRRVYQAQFKLVPNHIKIRAKKYQHSVNLNAIEQNISPELIFSVIETESMFNPAARSPAPAFGLMQLVPTSGARDAYQYLYQQDRIVSDTYLYNPDNNIKLGTAYLHRLYYDYFSGIHSEKSRLWATIAAYNTGPGNVFRAFAGRYNRNRFTNRDNWKRIALREINQRSPEQVFQFMKQALPYTETQRYIHKVRSKMGKYVASR